MARAGDYAVDAHPKRSDILQAMAERKSLRLIRQTICPNVSEKALGRYRTKIFRPGAKVALQNTVSKVRSGDVSNLTQAEVDGAKQVSAAEPLLARLRKRYEDIDAGVQHARAAADIKGLSAIISTDIKAVEAEAKLLGIGGYAPSQQTTVNTTNTIVVLPRQDQPAARIEPPTIDAEIIDVE